MERDEILKLNKEGKRLCEYLNETNDRYMRLLKRLKYLEDFTNKRVASLLRKSRFHPSNFRKKIKNLLPSSGRC